MDFERVLDIVRALNREGVEYITFGAIALAAHGFARATSDADFFVNPTQENIERLRRALRSLWDDPHLDEISADDLAGDYPAVRYGPPDEEFTIDFLSRLGEAYSYGELPSEVVEFGGVPIRVVTAATLYEMKRSTVRPKDRIDAAALNEEYHFEE